MMGYRFMARLRRYYTCIGRSSEWGEGGGEGGRKGREKGEWDASSIETYMVFGFKKTGEFSKVGGWWKGRKLCAIREAKGGSSGEEGYEEWKGRRIVLWTADLAIVGIMKPRRDFSLFSRTQAAK